jgi:2-amino-4-hydroxy-6-hydroxymethyldihydropteridine diphosphokinase
MGQSQTVFVGLGSNLGDSANLLLEGWQTLGRYRGVTLEKISSPYLSAPVGMTSSFWFTNAVGRLQTSRGAEELLDILLDTEKQLGRIRDRNKQGYQDREIDLDLIYYGQAIIDTPRLTLPHPHRTTRLFVLAPMAAIAPDFIDPETGDSIFKMHRRLQQRIDAGTIEPQEITLRSWPR